MTRGHSRSWALTVVVAALLCAASATALAQTRVVYAPVARIASVDGAVLYDAYCAQCHGRTGRGNGPAARAFNHPPADLTLIVVREGGFNPMHVQNEIANARCDRNLQMPDWMKVLRRVYESEGEAMMAVHNVARHIETFQQR